jgi:hypothetical protein
MAITRAQQFRQMLEDGGMLVSPSKDGRRPGYRRSKYDSSGGGLGGSKSKTGRPDSPGPSNRDDAREQYSVTQTKTGKVPGGGKDGKPAIVTGDQGRKSRAAFLAANPPATLTALRQRGVGSVPFGVPGSSFFNAIRGFRDYTLGKNIDYFSDLKNRAIVRGRDPRAKRGIDFYERSADGYKEYMKDRLAGKIDAAGNLKSGFMRDAQGNIMSTGNDGRDSEAEQLALLAQNQIPQSTAPTTTSNPLGGLAFRFLAEGGMAEDAPVGGIMDIESGRQMYFLGKLVKKATRAVKKVAKSPIGKAALFAGLAGAGGFGPLKGLKPMLFGTKGYFNIGSALHGSGVGKSIAGTTGLLGKLGLTKGAGSMALTGKGILSAISAASLLPMLGLGTGDEDEEEAEEILRGSGLDIASIRNNPYTFRSSVGDGTGLGRRFVADGGRIGFRDGTSEFMDFVRSMGLSEDKLKQLDINSYNAVLQAFQRAKEGQKPQTEEKEMAEGGKAEPVAKDTMPLLKMGGKEMDLRDNGGFVPIGRMERADDVPARLSKNEFVFTADAVRNAGGGDIDKGAEVMYNMMQNLESGGEVSEESQGLKGAREMFQTSKRLEEVL